MWSSPYNNTDSLSPHRRLPLSPTLPELYSFYSRSTIGLPLNIINLALSKFCIHQMNEYESRPEKSSTEQIYKLERRSVNPGLLPISPTHVLPHIRFSLLLSSTSGKYFIEKLTSRCFGSCGYTSGPTLPRRGFFNGRCSWLGKAAIVVKASSSLGLSQSQSRK